KSSVRGQENISAFISISGAAEFRYPRNRQMWIWSQRRTRISLRISDSASVTCRYQRRPERPTPQPKIFLGRHFDARSEKTVAPLRRLLYLLGFDVLEGEAYNSRSIPEKVKSRIDQQPIYLAVVTNAESHDWLIAEAAYALGKNKH